MDLCNNCCRMIQAVIKRDSNGYWNTKQQYFCKLVELAESAQHCPLCSVFHSNIPKDVPNDGLGWNASWVPLQDGLSQLSIDVPHAASDWLVTYPQRTLISLIYITILPFSVLYLTYPPPHPKSSLALFCGEPNVHMLICCS